MLNTVLKFCLIFIVLQLSACAVVSPPDAVADGGVASNAWTLAPIQSESAPVSAPVVVPLWQHTLLPGKQATEFAYARQEGRHAMAVHATSSASMLRQALHIPAARLGRVNFSWKVPELIDAADMALREADDSPVRVVLAFEGDRSRFSAKNAMLSELSHAITGEPLPYATLMYVWCNTRAPGSVIVNPRTDRIRKLVVESGSKNLNRWLDYERDIRADFVKAFGEPPGALLGIGIMTDTDNTHSTTQAWYGPLTLASGQ